MGKIEEFLKVETGSGDGYGNGDGYGYGDGSGYGDGYGYGNGDGNGYGYGYGDGSGIKSINGKPVYDIDSVNTIIEHVRGTCARGFIVNSDLTLTPCFITKGHNMFAHGETFKQAVEDLEEKIFEDMDVDEKIEKFIETFKLGKKYLAKDFYDWHNKLTGSCEMGRKAFARDHGIDVDNDQMTVEEFISLTKDSFGGSVIRQLASKLSVEV